MKKDLLWFGPPYSYSGYATHNRFTLFELLKHGWNIRLIPSELHIPEDLIGKDILKQMVENTSIDRNAGLCLNLIPPPALPLWGGYTILYTTIESLTVHPGFFMRCKQYDEVWVPCKSNMQSMLDAGWPKKRLHYVPEGVDADFWHPAKPKLAGYDSDLFTFMYCGDWSYRKGIDLIIQGFCSAFEGVNSVRLLLLVHYQGGNTLAARERMMQEYRGFLDEVNVKPHDNVRFVFDFIDDDKLPNFFRCADVYLAPTRGEAWGLPIIQAMACGVPAVTTGWGGQMDYCTKRNSFIVPVDAWEPMEAHTNVHVDFYKEQLFPVPSLTNFMKSIRRCYLNRNVARDKGYQSRCDVSRSWTWSNTGNIADARLSKVLQLISKKGA